MAVHHRRPQACPDLEDALLNVGTAIQLPQFSMDSMLGLLPDGAEADEILMQHYRDLVKICGPLQVSREHLNAKWNKGYGIGGTYWTGALSDGRDRGDLPYYCPNGWVRLSLKVCSDHEFEKKYQGWGYLYHGTQGKHVGPILTSGLRASQGLCYCGSSDSAVFFSPSIEYSGHPRYASIEFNPETRKWIQLVLQCRINPTYIWKTRGETLKCARYGVKIDSNVPNSRVEVLVKPNWTDPRTGHKFIKNAVVCTGVMMRVTDSHPCDLDYWWTRSIPYMQEYGVADMKVDYTLVDDLKRLISRAKIGFQLQEDCRWRSCQMVEVVLFSFRGEPTSASFEITVRKRHVYTSEVGILLSRLPFAKGSMRNAYLLQVGKSWTGVVKKYNRANVEHIQGRQKSSIAQAIRRDVATYKTAKHYAEMFNAGFKRADWKVDFLEPYEVTIDGELYFGEKYQDGEFIKWNDNTGMVNMTEKGRRENMNSVAASYAHFSYHASGENLMVVDIQGWDNAGKITFTDPQIHTRSISRGGCPLVNRFSVGNLGRTGMFKFFSSHTCSPECTRRGLRNPLHEL